MKAPDEKPPLSFLCRNVPGQIPASLSGDRDGRPLPEKDLGGRNREGGAVMADVGRPSLPLGIKLEVVLREELNQEQLDGRRSRVSGRACMEAGAKLRFDVGQAVELEFVFVSGDLSLAQKAPGVKVRGVFKDVPVQLMAAVQNLQHGALWNVEPVLERVRDLGHTRDADMSDVVEPLALFHEAVQLHQLGDGGASPLGMLLLNLLNLLNDGMTRLLVSLVDEIEQNRQGDESAAVDRCDGIEQLVLGHELKREPLPFRSVVVQQPLDGIDELRLCRATLFAVEFPGSSSGCSCFDDWGQQLGSTPLMSPYLFHRLEDIGSCPACPLRPRAPQGVGGLHGCVSDANAKIQPFVVSTELWPDHDARCHTGNGIRDQRKRGDRDPFWAEWEDLCHRGNGLGCQYGKENV